MAGIRTSEYQSYVDPPEYKLLLEQARRSDTSDIEKMKIFRLSGVDYATRPIFIWDARAMGDVSKVDLDQLLSFVLLMLDPISEVGDYVWVVFASEATDQNVPPATWVGRVLKLLARKIRKNLKAVYLVHPSSKAKVAMNALASLNIISPKFWKKVVTIDKIDDLWQYFEKSQLTVPEYVIKHDEYLRQNPSFLSGVKDAIRRVSLIRGGDEVRTPRGESDDPLTREVQTKAIKDEIVKLRGDLLMLRSAAVTKESEGQRMYAQTKLKTLEAELKKLTEVAKGIAPASSEPAGAGSSSSSEETNTIVVSSADAAVESNGKEPAVAAQDSDISISVRD